MWRPSASVLLSWLYIVLLLAGSIVSSQNVRMELPPYFTLLSKARVMTELDYFKMYGEWHQRVVIEILYYMMVGRIIEGNDITNVPVHKHIDSRGNIHWKQYPIAAVEHPITGDMVHVTKDFDLNWGAPAIDKKGIGNVNRNMTELCDSWDGITCYERSDNGLHDTCWCVSELELLKFTWADNTDSTNDECIQKCRKYNLTAKSHAPLDVITKIEIADFGLVGVTNVPGVLEQLRYLEVLDVSGNQLIGTLPKEIGNIKGLKYLDLSSTDLLGTLPPFLSRLSKLEVLKLSGTNLNGTLPYELLVELPDLKTLDLSSNKFSGSVMTIPPESSKLETLNLAKNQIKGVLPELETFANIEILDLSDNMLTGTLPSDLSKMQNLRKLNIHRNRFTGSIPSGQWSMSKLEHLNLGENALDGKIPVDIFSPKLKTLIISQNYLVGELPSEISRSPLLETLHLEGNLLAGSVPKELYQLKEISDVEIYDNKFRGSISTALCQNDIRSNFPSSYVPFPCTNFIACPKGYFHPSGHASDTHGCYPCPPCHTDDLKDESCRFIGQIECSDNSVQILEGDIDGDGVVSQREVLRLVFVTTNGNNWKDEFLTWGDMVQHPDACTLPGVNCKEGKVSKIDLRGVGLCQNWQLLTEHCGLLPPELGLLSDSLEVLDLSNSGGGNRFPLTIPTEIGMLTELKILNLSMNNLHGVPPTISSCRKLMNLNLSTCELLGKLDPAVWTVSSLEILDLRNNLFKPQHIPSEIGLLTNLREFKNSQSQFEGGIPNEICKLTRLKNLEMYGNKLDGKMPECIKNLSNLSRLDIYGNDISGDINWLKHLPRLEILHLAVNNFSSTIPTELGTLSSLSWVDLSQNRLMGKIPSSMASLPQLIDLRLGANNLFSVPEEICKSKTINGGNIDDSCDHILCRIGTISSRGYAVPESACIPCPEYQTTLYAGQRECMLHDESDYLDILYTALSGREWGAEHSLDDMDECRSSHITCNEKGEVTSMEIPISTIEMDESLFESHASVLM